jgi:1,4-dihydroxy-2-naphthoate octaprenyltransferase
MGSPVALWVKALRAPFFQAVIVPTVLGASIAWHQTGTFHWGYFVLTVVGAILVNAGTNLSNDYFDHTSRADDINEGYTPFSGGSRVIQDRLVSPRAMLVGAVVSFAAASAIGFYLGYVRGWPLLVIGALGILSGYLYTASPVRAVYHGWGEVLAGLNCGPLVVLGAYYVQAQSFTPGVVVASIPIGLLAAGILYINQFSDYEPDRAAGKYTLVVRLGPGKAVIGYYVLLACMYLVIVVGSGVGLMPRLSLIALLSLPLAWKTVRVLREHYANGVKMIPAMAGNIAVHLSVGVLLSCSYIVSKMLR